jgi:hypothetical protein
MGYSAPVLRVRFGGLPRYILPLLVGELFRSGAELSAFPVQKGCRIFRRGVDQIDICRFAGVDGLFRFVAVCQYVQIAHAIFAMNKGHEEIWR